MHDLLLPASDRSRIVMIHATGKEALAHTLDGLPPETRAWAKLNGFSAAAGELLVVPGKAGTRPAVLFGLGGAEAPADPFIWGRLASDLPDGRYAFASPPDNAGLAVLAFLLGAYRFDRYRKGADKTARLRLPAGVDDEEVTRIADSVCLARDLINTPANDMGPAELEAAARALGGQYGARVAVTRGAALARAFPLVHAVGRASARPPRLINMVWGAARHPRVTLVGKGVCFDTGGLDLKTSAGMALMKKDMGGAANAMALARMIMDAKLPVRLRLIVPAVENAVSGAAFRPGDVYRSRKGLTVEIGNTDAEGRLILADALALGDEEAPDMLVDLATLTGAARVALGPDLPPFYSDDEALAGEIAAAASAVNDPLWRMPLWRAYDGELESGIADVSHISSGAFAGSITAALFLRRFVDKAKAWAHFDIFAWTPKARPGRPEGGEAQAVRALYALIRDRYGRAP